MYVNWERLTHDKKANITVPLIPSNKCVQYGAIIVLLAAMP